MRFFRFRFEQFIRRHKIARTIFLLLLAFFIIIFIIGSFSWDSLLSWIITKENTDLNEFIFSSIFAVLTLIISIVLVILVGKKKK